MMNKFIRAVSALMFLLISLNITAEETTSSESTSETKTTYTAGSESSQVKNLLSSAGKVLFGNEPNSLLVIDYPENINRVTEYLDMVYISPRQVHIEARVAEVKLGGEHALGVQWSLFADSPLKFGPIAMYSTTAAGGIAQALSYKSTGYPPVASTQTAETPFSLTIFDENINLVLQTLANRLSTTILSAPSITTVNNRPAEIKVIDRIPWAEPDVTTVGEASTSTQVSWNINYEEAGILLKVTPTISEDGNISMFLEPEISENVTSKNLSLTIQAGSSTFTYTVPHIDTRRASTKVVVGNGQTIIIGGLIKNKVIKGETKVPLLGDMPYLGYLFKSKKETVDKTELLIFVSPTIVDPSQIGHMAKMKKSITESIEGSAVLPEKKFKAVVPVEGQPETVEEAVEQAVKENKQALQNMEKKAQASLQAKESQLKEAQEKLNAALLAKEEALKEAQAATLKALQAQKDLFNRPDPGTKKELQAKEKKLKEMQLELEAKEEQFRQASAAKEKELRAFKQESLSAIKANDIKRYKKIRQKLDAFEPALDEKQQKR